MERPESRFYSIAKVVTLKQIPYPSNTNQESSGHQHQNTSQKGEDKLFSKKSVKRSISWDGTRFSILETLGQTQNGGDDGGDVGCVEFSCSNISARRETKHHGEQTGGVRIEYYVAQTSITKRT